MKGRFLALLLLAGIPALAGPRLFFGVGFGGFYGPRVGYYAPPPVYAYAPPPALFPAYVPGYARPGYSWVGGYYYPAGARYSWRAGYWARPPFIGARWVAPRYFGHRYYGGYWRR